jgi:hypothetical protein
MKKVINIFLVVVMVILSITSYNVSYAESNNESKFRIYSPEFPNVDFDTNYVDLENVNINIRNNEIITDSNDENTLQKFDQILDNTDGLEESIINAENQSKKLIGIVTAKTLVEETYAQDESGNTICSSSKLMSPDDNISTLSNSKLYLPIGSNVATTLSTEPVQVYKYNLTVTLGVYESTSSTYAVYYDVIGIADWDPDTISTSYSSKNPAVGDDFIALYWGGSLSSKNKSLTLQSDSAQIENSAYVSDSTANAGIVWGFSELYTNVNEAYSLDIATAQATLYKKTKTGDETTVAMKYIHTYQSVVGSIDLIAGVLPVVTLSSTDKQWSLVAEYDGVAY